MDLLGLEITAGSAEEVEAHNRFVHGLLRLSEDVLDLFDAVADHPFCPMLQIDAAILGLYALTQKGAERAKRHLEIAPLEKGNPREWSLYKVVSAMSSHQYEEAMTGVEQHVERWPGDLMAIKLAEYIYYLNGQKYHADRFLRLTRSVVDHHRESAPFLATHSFALELNGEYEVAEEVALHSIELEVGNPWAHHTLSHTCMERGQVERGIDLLEGFAPMWDSFNRFIRSHNLWHLGLLYLEQLAFDKIPPLVSRTGWLTNNLLVTEEIDAAALFWRLDMEGRGREEWWERLAHAIGADARFVSTPFVAAHLVYALKRGGRLEALDEALKEIEKTQSAQWQKVGHPLIHAALAFADGNCAKAATLLDPIIDRIGWVGGSDAQIALFQQTYLKCLIGSGRLREAKGYLAKWVGDREMTPLERGWLT